MPDEDSIDAALDITCPRCGQLVSERFYGPCDACRSQLRATVAGESKELVSTDFVPKMNVTPNAVALKE